MESAGDPEDQGDGQGLQQGHECVTSEAPCGSRCRGKPDKGPKHHNKGPNRDSKDLVDSLESVHSDAIEDRANTPEV